MIFKDRVDAGEQLARLLRPLKQKDPIVLGLPRGGVPVAYQVAHKLNLPLDVIIVRKLGVPSQPELAFGAVGEDGAIFLNEHIIKELAISKDIQLRIESRERQEISKRAERFRRNQKPLDIKGRAVIIVDDGIATGATMQVACLVAKARGASEVIVAAPVAARDSVKKLQSVTDSCIVLSFPENFSAVGQWYEDFTTTTDDDVIRILQKSWISIGH